MKIEIDIKEIIPITEFELNWRWDKTHNSTITPIEIEQIQPVSKTESRRLNKVIDYFESIDNLRRQYKETDWISANSESDIKIEEFRNRLISLLKPWNEDVIVTWNRTTTLRTTKEIFIKYWDNFCYTSSDDVTIISEETNWIMFFSHFGVANIWSKI